MNDTEDFEFKPLNKGLGFHKKLLDLKEEMNPTEIGISQTGIMPTPRKNISAATSSIEKPTSVPLTSKIIRPGSQPLHTPLGWTPALKNVEIIEKPNEPQLVPAASSIPAALFDVLMVVGLGLLFSAIVFALTQLEISEIGEMLLNDLGSRIAMVVLFIAVFEIYTVTCRTFFGKTLGEWAFDCRLGSIVEQENLFYPVQVAWRSLLIAITGFVVLPFLSLILGKDVPGILSGVSLYSEKR